MAAIREVAFGVDEFQKEKILSPQESLQQILYNIFVMRPGQLPSQPDKGINIRSYLYRLEDDIDTNDLKQKIFRNCSDLLTYLTLDDIVVNVMDWQGQGILLIILPIKLDDDEAIILTFNLDDKDNIVFQFKVESMKIINT